MSIVEDKENIVMITSLGSTYSYNGRSNITLTVLLKTRTT